jgi:5S rRNA maturation endonuclease (ribonuclease M5)
MPDTLTSPTREDILAAYPLLDCLAKSGVKLRGSGNQRTANKCPRQQHKPDHWCVSVDVAKQIWHCNDCGIGGSVIDWHMHATGKPLAEVMAELSGREAHPSKPARTDAGRTSPKIVATYDYTDESGILLYQVVRYDPKTFRQRQPDAHGGWRWDMDGVTRVLYRLPEILLGQSVLITEGEKDVETLRKMGFIATTNVGGAGKWLEAYSDVLAAKGVIILPDNDKPGKDHAEKVVESLTDKAASIKVVPMPAPYKDVTAWVETFSTPALATKALQDLIDRTPHRLRPLPILDIADMEAQYRSFLREADSRAFDLGKFLPSLGSAVRKLVPGELVLIMASTGVGKTALLQQFAIAAAPLPTLLFELELPSELMFERFVQMQVSCYASDVESEYKRTETPLWKSYRKLHHIFVCPDSGLTPEDIERLIHRSALKIGQPPAVVGVDYIGLVKSPGRSRYEAVSYAAEQLKVIAKRTGTIVLMASQISRPDKSDTSIEVRLHDGKDSGALENSSGLVLGVWRPQPDTLTIKVLKNTKGASGKVVECHYDGAKMQMREKPQVNGEFTAKQTARPVHADP